VTDRSRTDFPIRVLYIAGSGRSGSTILDNILGQLEGFVSVGEVRFLWERGMIDDRLCGCGRSFSTCPFWSEVLTKAFGSPRGVDPVEQVALLSRGIRARRIPRLLGRRRRTGFVTHLEPLPERLTALYRAIAEVSGASWIVDSSKLPTYGALLSGIPGFDVRAVHLVRDPRATAYSWLRKKRLPDGDGLFMQQQGPVRSSALWTLWNAAPGWFWRGRSRLVVRYEDFVRSPRPAVESILTHVGAPVGALPFVSEREVELAPAHGVAGNPSRFTTGVVALKSDDAWRTEMRPRHRRVVTAVTWPLLHRFGYAGGGRSASGDSGSS
jgi:hypothetical protein